MNNAPRQKLRDLVLENGTSLYENPRYCEALLRDYCGIYKREIYVLIAALKEQVAITLIHSSPNIPYDIVSSKFVERLCDNLALSEDAARWAVESWAIALQIKQSPRNVHAASDIDKKERSVNLNIPSRNSKTNQAGSTNSFQAAIKLGRETYDKEKKLKQTQTTYIEPRAKGAAGRTDKMFCHALVLCVEMNRLPFFKKEAAYISSAVLKRQLRISSERANAIIDAMIVEPRKAALRMAKKKKKKKMLFVPSLKATKTTYQPTSIQ